MSRGTPAVLVAVSIAMALPPGPALAQIPGGPGSSLGDVPGRGQSPAPVAGDNAPLQGGLGPGVSRAPSSVTRPAQPFGLPEPLSLTPPATPTIPEPPNYGTLSLPLDPRNEGPENGISLDDAIERLVQENLDLRGRFLEIPQAQADVLTAGLRANPVFYYDTQLIPYGNYSAQRPGGQTQYDVNVTLPLDWNGKRRVRAEVATRARRVIEAQYQDAVRLQINSLYTSFVDVLAARETVRFAETSIEGLDRFLRLVDSQHRGGERTGGDVNRVRIQRDTAQVGLSESEERLLQAKRALSPLLNVPMPDAEVLEYRGTIFDTAPPPPPIEELGRIALNARPDLQAFRLGVDYARSDVRLQQAERYQDVFLLAQPYTFQNNEPFGSKSATSWGVGLTVPLPIFDRNQGRIQRAQVNVRQTQIELETLQQQVLAEVRQAERRYAVSRDSVSRIERDLIPSAIKVRDEAMRRYQAGETDISVVLNAQRDYNDLVRQYRDTLIRHRRSMLELNTAVGCRILP